jgi:hypothetical protein
LLYKGLRYAASQLSNSLEIPPTPRLEVCSFGHGERRREARKKVSVVLAIGHTLRAQKALGRPDSLPGFLEVIQSLFENGIFVGHARSIRADTSLQRVDEPGSFRVPAAS